MRIGAVIAAILLPPLGVFLTRGMGRDFWIAIVLTLLFFLPGVLFALFVTGGGSTAAFASRFRRRRASAA